MQWLDAVGSRREVRWLEAANEGQGMHRLGATGQLCQQEAVVTVVVDAAAEESKGKTEEEEEGEGGQLPWGAATWVQPEGAANAEGR